MDLINKASAAVNKEREARVNFEYKGEVCNQYLATAYYIDLLEYFDAVIAGSGDNH